MSRRFALALVVLSSLAFAAPKTKPKKGPPPPPPPVTEPMPRVVEALSSSVLDLVVSATKVQAFRVSDSGGLRPDPAKAIAAEFERGAAGKELDAAALVALRSVLYDEKSYRLEQDTAKCRFAAHLSFQMQSGLDTLEALISFKCNQVLFVVGKPGGRWLPKGTFDLKPARKKLLELAKATLPQDAATQNLK